jgi:two-component system, cell cycle response regulator
MTSELRPRILLIDDDRHAHERFHSMTGNRYQLYSAYDGEDGLARAVECMPDLILLDVMMPGTDGLNVCGNLRAHPLLCDIPIIMLTALDDQETRLKSMMEGADEFLTKPFNELEMTLRLRNLLQINRYRRLQNERARTQWLLDSAQEAFLVLDDQLTIEYANHRACALLGLSQPVGIGEPINFQLAVCDFHSEPRTLWDEWLASPQDGDNGALHLVRPATSVRPAMTLQMRTHVHLVRNRASILVRLTDITGEVQAQSLRWSFHHHVAHKLFTPITGLKAGLDLIGETASGKLDQLELDAFEVAMKSVARLLNDCRKVVEYLDLSNTCPPSGTFPLKDISALCGEIWSSSGIRMAVCDLDAKLWQRALAMPEITLAAILAELTANSRKFSLMGPPQITLRIEASARGNAIIRFSDAGMHIPPEQLKFVWMPHFQAENTFTGAVPGMGLGLASIALQIWQVGGAFAINNNDFGKGVTVTLEIPLTRAAALEESRAQPQVSVAVGAGDA